MFDARKQHMATRKEHLFVLSKRKLTVAELTYLSADEKFHTSCICRQARVHLYVLLHILAFGHRGKFEKRRQESDLKFR